MHSSSLYENRSTSEKNMGWYCPVQPTQKEEQEESNIVTTEIVEPG